MTLSLLILAIGIGAMLPSLLVMAIVWPFSRDLAIFLGVFTFGYCWSSFIDRMASPSKVSTKDSDTEE